MFNNKERDNMKNTILVVEITEFSSGRKNYNIKKNADTLEKATEYLVASVLYCLTNSSCSEINGSICLFTFRLK